MQQLLALFANVFAADVIQLVFYAASMLFCLLFTHFLWLFVHSHEGGLTDDPD